MDLPAWPDDALAQPTRARLFGLLAQLRRPAGTEELAARLDLHPNGVRVHLERLREAGMVARERTRQARLQEGLAVAGRERLGETAQP